MERSKTEIEEKRERKPDWFTMVFYVRPASKMLIRILAVAFEMDESCIDSIL